MTNGRYKIELDSGSDLLLYEEVILKYELLIHKDIDNKLLDKINCYNLEWDVYYVALKSLKSRFKSIKEIRDFLIKKEYPIDLIDKAINKLLSQKYLDDRSFSKSYINNQIITTSKGPRKISKELISKGVSKDIIDEEIVCFDENEQILKVNKIANRLLKSNRTRGGMVLKKKITNDLINLGYDISVINKVLDTFDFNDNLDIAKREYDKLYRKLSRKYSGKELDFKIKEKLYQKGLYYED